MASIKKIQKELVKMSEEDLKQVLSFLSDEEEVETKEEEIVEEIVEETKTEEKKEYVTVSELEKLMEKFSSQFAQKETVEEVKEAVNKKSAFGVKQSSKKPNDEKNQMTAQDYLNQMKANGY